MIRLAKGFVFHMNNYFVEKWAKIIDMCIIDSLNIGDEDLAKNFAMLYHIGLFGRVFANGPGDRGSILSRVKPKTQKMVLDISLLNTHHYKVRIKGKEEQSKERNSALPYKWV